MNHVRRPRFDPAFPSFRPTAWIILGLLFLWSAGSSPLFGDKFFAHGVVGTNSAGVSAQTTIEITYAFGVGKVATNASGALQFFQPNGNPVEVQVTGEGFQNESRIDIPFELGPATGRYKLRYELSSSVGQTVFWTRIVETTGFVNGRIQFDLFENNVLSTSVPVPATSSGPINAFTARLAGSLNTGVAVANPGDTPAIYWAIALNSQQEIVGMRNRTINPMRQNAMFVNQLIPDVGASFDGFLVILSDRNLPVVSLEQNGLELAATLSLDPEEISPALPFAVGQVEDYLDATVNNNSNCVIAQAHLTFNRGPNTREGDVSQDGNFLIGPLAPGAWQAHVEAPGYLPFNQSLSFPRPPQNIGVTNLQWINPAWLEATLAPGAQFEGTVIRPQEDIDFFFQTAGFGARGQSSEIDEEIRQAFRTFVSFELPQTNMRVQVESGDTVVLGGSSRYIESPTVPAPGEAGTFVVRANLSLDRSARTTVFLQTATTTGASGLRVAESRLPSRYWIVTDDPGGAFPAGVPPEAMAIASASLEYNPNLLVQEFPDRASMLAEVTRRFWFAVFLRSPSATPLEMFALTGLPGETEPLSSVYTQIGSESESPYSTPLDDFYWALIRRRPIGTRITSAGEFLPDQ